MVVVKQEEEDGKKWRYAGGPWDTLILRVSVCPSSSLSLLPEQFHLSALFFSDGSLAHDQQAEAT